MTLDFLSFKIWKDEKWTLMPVDWFKKDLLGWDYHAMKEWTQIFDMPAIYILKRGCQLVAWCPPKVPTLFYFTHGGSETRDSGYPWSTLSKGPPNLLIWLGWWRQSHWLMLKQVVSIFNTNTPFYKSKKNKLRTYWARKPTHLREGGRDLLYHKYKMYFNCGDTWYGSFGVTMLGKRR